ncbi:amino-acid n-acetyltransferase subunit [Grosmannia clavigera kw1407]|uniref:Amino-acid n-acetyltransferase subunit n=1 Tax=Grosmannia clavigera (strain kw1407 / UAMH 11150) TaxID=655863 RepID=F0XA55_GROCL|nr:amino-acid n-acetyltransferase subunit [Grosmannia clavigera kw1407]EFX05788.1 amino-acid n-acetyltransferase subunit [Grosmannia clavigera kw1407]
MANDEAREAGGSPGATRDESAVSSELRGLSLNTEPSVPALSQPPPSRPISSGVVSVDITAQFMAAAATLGPGELIKDPFFTLFESVGALEIMDPKMDSGCLPAEELEDDTYDFARPLLPEEVVGIIDQLLCLEHYSGGSAPSIVLGTDSCPRPPENNWAQDVALALDARLEFRDAFLHAIELAELRIQPDALQVPWKSMLAAMEGVKKTHKLGKNLPGAFSVKLQRRLASTMPPRPIVQPSFDEACERWLRFCKDGASVIDVLRYADPQSLLKFVLTFQAQKPQPLVFIRTLMQDLIFADNIMLGQMSIRQVMDDDLALLVLPASMLLDPTNDEVEAVQDPRFAVAQHMEEFRQRAFPAYFEVFRTLCQNRSRTRRMLCRAIQEWDKLQIDAEDIDQLVEHAVGGGRSRGGMTSEGPTAADALPLSSWAFLYKLQLMEWVTQLGFELEVYQVDELPGMYWYLSYLAKRRVQHVERIRSFTVRAIQEHQQPRAGRKASTLSTAEHTAYVRSLAFLRATLIDASASWELAEALSCFYSVLQRTGEMPIPDRPFGSEELRYELRMRPFAAGGPSELPPFDIFAAEVKQADRSVAEMLTYAEKAVGAAKKGFEALTKLDEREESFSAFCHDRWVARTKGMQKSAIFAGIAVATAQKAALDEGTQNRSRLTIEVPTPDKCYHEWWVVPKITIKPAAT